MTTQTTAQPSGFSFVTMVENLVAGEHLEKNPWTPDAMWHNIANQTVEALVARGELRREEADIITGLTPLDALPAVIGCPEASPIWRCIYTAYRLTAGLSFGNTKYEIRNIMARRAVTTKQFSFMLGVLVDRDVRQPKNRKAHGARKPATLQTARNAFGDGGFLTEDVPGKYWVPTYEPLPQLLKLALAGNPNARITLMIGGGFVLMMDGYLTRDRESKFYEGSAPFRGSPSAILADLAKHEHGLRLLASAWQAWEPTQPAHEYDIPAIREDGSVIITGDTRETRRPERLTEYRLYEIANPAKAMAGFLKQQETRKAKNQAATPENRDRDNRERLTMALDIAHDAATALKDSPVSPPPHPFGSHEEWEHVKSSAHQVYDILVKHEPDPQAGFIASEAPEDGEDDEYAEDD
ncbi:hypothetical protein HRW07_08015 [Streptomyces lunaelactis]|uniref:hypothetical protein n=1 Tax=Streptomyces lunaelactis TaxID=1535768 RepID=UPI0015850A0C|nr:hypothetical protein [Streptomyces lunaelactis]NUL03186.1 hypothetical protein [Streptomyces lunaelactis]